MKKYFFILAFLLICGNAFADYLTYPTEVDTVPKKYIYCMVLKRKAINYFNSKGALFKNGDITETQWENIKSVFFSKYRTLTEEELRLRDIIKNNIDFDISIEDVPAWQE